MDKQERRANVGIGSVVFIHDEYYGRRKYREGWRPHTITGQTRVSWLVGEGRGTIKLPKKGGTWLATPAEVEEVVWLHTNRYFVGDAVGQVADYDTVKAIATMIGYQDRPER